MAPAGHEEQNVLTRLVENRRNHGHVRQMGSSIIGRVHHVDIAGLHRPCVRRQHGPDGFTHGAEMNRDMGCIGDQHAIGVEDRAGKIEPFFDVHGIGRVLQGDTHLLGNRHEQIVEHFQHNRITIRTNRKTALHGHHAVEDEVSFCRQRRLPPRFDDRRRRLFANDRGAQHLVPWQ